MIKTTENTIETCDRTILTEGLRFFLFVVPFYAVTKDWLAGILVAPTCTRCLVTITCGRKARELVSPPLKHLKNTYRYNISHSTDSRNRVRCRKFMFLGLKVPEFGLKVLFVI